MEKSLEVVEKRSGKLAAHSFTHNFGPSITAQYPLEIFMIDHTKVDVITVDEQQRLPISRPELTLAIDVFSRCIAGFYMSFESPSVVSVGFYLTHSVFDKTDYLNKFNIQHNLPLKGKPEKIIVDHGSEFKSEVLLKGCEQQEKWLTHAIVGKYHLEIHSSLIEPPLALFQQGLDTRSKEINLVKNQKAFLIDFLPIEKRTLQRHGFVIEHIFYFSNALIPWISSKHENDNKLNQIVEFDINSIKPFKDIEDWS